MKLARRKVANLCVTWLKRSSKKHFNQANRKAWEKQEIKPAADCLKALNAKLKTEQSLNKSLNMFYQLTCLAGISCRCHCQQGLFCFRRDVQSLNKGMQ